MKKTLQANFQPPFGADGLVNRMWERYAGKKGMDKKIVGRSIESGAVGDKQPLAKSVTIPGGD